MDEIVKERAPKIAVELGGFIGYSAVRIARLLRDDAKLYTIEMKPAFVKLAREVIDFAGLGSKVSGASQEVDWVKSLMSTITCSEGSVSPGASSVTDICAAFQ